MTDELTEIDADAIRCFWGLATAYAYEDDESYEAIYRSMSSYQQTVALGYAIPLFVHYLFDLAKLRGDCAFDALRYVAESSSAQTNEILGAVAAINPPRIVDGATFALDEPGQAPERTAEECLAQKFSASSQIVSWLHDHGYEIVAR